jgi:hypothetical protein
LGLVEEANSSFRRWQTLVDDLRHQPSRAYSLVQQCHFCFARGDAALVAELASEGRELSVSEGFGLWVPIMDMFLAWSSLAQGADPAGATEQFRRAKALVDGSGTHITEIDFTSMFAELLLAANQPQEVFRIAESALAITRAGEVMHLEPELHRLQGDAARALGDRERADAFYRRAIEGARAVGASGLEHRAASALGVTANKS